MYRYLELVTLLLLSILLLDDRKLVDARSWRNIVVVDDVGNNKINSDGGHHIRPGELEFKNEEDPFLFPLSATISTTKERIKEKEQVVVASTTAPTVIDQYPIYENNFTDTASTSVSATVSESDEFVIHNIFVHPSSSDGTTSDSDSISNNKKGRSNGRSPLAAFVEPTDLPTSSVLPTTTPTEFRFTGSPTGTPTGTPTTNTNTITSFVYPENSVTPSLYYSRPPPRGYFNYDSSAKSSYGPGYPVIAYNFQDELVVQYTNNRWVDNFRPPSLLPSPTALAITNSDGENNDAGSSSSNPYSYSYYYWDEFGPDGYGFGPWKDVLTKRTMRGVDSNQCGNVGNQSPIDIRLSGVACIEHHQIRTRAGDFRMGGDNNNVKLKILPSKLRIWVQRRPCRHIENPVCSEPDPPHADFPNGWGGFADMLHVDFKFPAEHRIYGQTFDGEMQIYHIHPGRKRLPVVSVLMKVVADSSNDDDADADADADGNNHYDYNNAGHNEYFQRAIDAFQYEYDTNMSHCANNAIRNHNRRSRRQRRLQNRAAKTAARRKWEVLGTPTNSDMTIAANTRGNNTSHIDAFDYTINVTVKYNGSETSYGEDRIIYDIDRLVNTTFGGSWEKLHWYANLLRQDSNSNSSNFTTQKEEHRRRRLAVSKWYPYHESLIPTYYFYGYDGSLTEPPCTEIVSWFVMDTPMTISKNQLEQMKHILFTNINGNTCEGSSVHFYNSVARPIQETTSNRQVWHCTRNDFVPDHERGID
mmetsp:Transcript_50738/g.57467  ORF Transcript_50738/g.57467 Transcript_50738/m.57467 type:complete len:755 (+) Transcript_50738:294-2558(+)